jgi:hypothetical protein
MLCVCERRRNSLTFHRIVKWFSNDKTELDVPHPCWSSLAHLTIDRWLTVSSPIRDIAALLCPG